MQKKCAVDKLSNHNVQYIVFKCNVLASFTTLRSQLDFKHMANNDGK